MYHCRAYVHGIGQILGAGSPFPRFGGIGTRIDTPQQYNSSTSTRSLIRPTGYISALLAALILTSAPDARAQIYKLPAPDTLAGNYFGTSVSVDGGTAVIGASGADSCGENSGAAFLYRLIDNGEWERTARLAPRDCHPDHFFGRSVAISGDRVVVTSHRPYFRESTSNAVYVFERSEGTNEWRETSRIEDPSGGADGPFASTLSLDDDRLIVASAGDASGGEYHGAAHIFERSADGSWSHAARLESSLAPEEGVFGASVALHGNRAVVSASTYFQERAGVIHVFERDPGTGAWSESGRISGIEDFFIPVDLHDDWILVGESRGEASGAGRARLFRLDDRGIWRKYATLRPSRPYDHGGFGSEVALTDGVALVTGFDEQLALEMNIDRVVYVFRLDSESGAWPQTRIIDVGDTAFGAALDVRGSTAVIGQASDSDAGQAYIVRLK